MRTSISDHSGKGGAGGDGTVASSSLLPRSLTSFDFPTLEEVEAEKDLEKSTFCSLGAPAHRPDPRRGNLGRAVPEA